MKYLNYEQFGAVGDGVTSDFDAIIACHEEANKTGTPVKTKDGAIYYIDGRAASAVIKTDVDFGTSKFIIDDRCVEQITSYVFSIESDFEKFDVTLPSLDTNSKTVDIPHEGNIYVKVFDDDKKIFIRKGLNMNNGTPMTDAFLVDEAGNISPSIDWDYKQITRAYAKRIDDKPITIRGGIFTTIANEEASFYRYYQRGFCVTRANVTITDFEHYVENEGEHGAPYHGFIRGNEAVNLTVSNAKITPRFIFYTESKVPGRPVAMGSYDLSFWSCINVTCKNVVQTIDIRDRRYWGIYTSNFCKNLELDGCTLSRFDAHQGVTNATIRSCTLGHQSVQLIGHGEFLIEDTVMQNDSNCFISLRGDYGSIWDGNITVKNCVWKTNCVNLSLIGASNLGDHDFGYVCRMGRNLTVDGLTVTDSDTSHGDSKKLSILNEYDKGSDENNKNYPYVPTESLTLKNVSVQENEGYYVTNCPAKYKALRVKIY